MKDIKLNEYGDIEINGSHIEMIKGKEEVIQQIRTIFKTNQGEWSFNEEYGLDYSNILTKKPNLDLIRDEIKNGLSQCSEEFSVDSVSVEFNKENRKLFIQFKAVNTEGEEIEGTEILSI